MGLRAKFLALAGIIGGIIAVMSLLGYYTSSQSLQASVENELRAYAEKNAAELEGWLKAKKAIGASTGSYLSDMKGDMSLLKRKEALSAFVWDKEVMDIGLGLEDGYFNFYNGKDLTNEVDPRQRPWYIELKQKRANEGAYFVDAYEDISTKRMAVSVIAPVFNKGEFIGGLGVDIALDTLSSITKNMKYHGEGFGIVAEASGNILSTSGLGKPMQNIKDIPEFSEKLSEFLKSESGYLTLDNSGETLVFAYTTIPETKYLVGIAAPYDFVFAPLMRLRLIYGFLFVFGLIVAVGVCMFVAGKLVNPIGEIRTHALEMSKGNLSLDNMTINSSDEIGELTNAFNTMQNNLRNLIVKMQTTGEQVAFASEELTRNANKSAQDSLHMAETVVNVTSDMEKQTSDIHGAKESVNRVFKDITVMEEKSHQVSDTSNQTAEAAERGSKLMENAVERMTKIEESVMSSAEVVKKLGDNSQQIGQIVEAISSIAEQTNLLSLNAAIEAARAGEQGRGFAVVAEEVRKLAAESQSSAEKIKERITSIQDDTAAAVSAMQIGTDEVKAGASAIKNVGSQFADILSMVNNIKSQMNEITDSVKTVTEGANHIVTAVDSIDAVSRKTSENTKLISKVTDSQANSNEKIADSSKELSNLAENMQTAIGKFKL